MANIGPTYTGPAAGQGFAVDADKLTHQPKEYVDPQIAINKQKKKDGKTGFDKAMDVDFDYGWQIHDQDLQLEIDNYRNKIAGWYKQGGDMNDPDFQRVVKAEQDRIGLHAKRSEYMKEKDEETRTFIKENGLYDETTTNKALTGVTKEVDEGGNIIGAKGAFDMNEEDYQAIRENSENFDMPKVWDDALEVFEDLSMKAYKETFYTTGTKKEVDTWKGKLVDAQGNINLGENQKKILYAHPMVKLFVDQQRAKKVGEDKIWEGVQTILEANKGVEKTVSRTNKPKHIIEAEKPKEAPVVDAGPKDMNISLGGKQASLHVSSNIEMEEPITIPSEGFEVYDMNAGEWIKAAAGDTDFKITSLKYVPVAQHGKGELFRIGDQKGLFKEQLDNENVGGRWMAQGTYTVLVSDPKDPDLEPEEREIQVLMRYEDVANRIPAKYDINKRTINSRRDEELVDNIRAYQKGLNKGQIQGVIDAVRKADDVIDEETFRYLIDIAKNAGAKEK